MWRFRLFPLLLGMASASACGGSADSQTAATELTVGAGHDEFVLEMNRHRLAMYPLNASVCEPLVRLTSQFQVEPWLATRWEYRGDNTWRFTLRSGVTFHDGQPFDGEAVRYSLGRAARTGIGHAFVSDASVRIVNDTTVDIRPERPNLRLVEQLVHPSYSMIAPGSDPRDGPVCTGPFRFEEYVPGKHLRVARNDAYWGGPARLQRITFRFIPDDNTRVLALRSGEVDVILDVHRSMAASLEDDHYVRVLTAPPGAVVLMYIVTRGAAPYTLMAEPALRRAVALALDRRALVQQILEGRAVEARTVNPPAVLGTHADRVRGVPYDPAEARRLLEQAGWRVGPDGVRARGGRRLSLAMIIQPGSVDPAVAQFVQAKLAEVGIELKIEQLDAGAFSSRITSGTYDVDLEVPNQNDANPAFLLGLRWYSRSDVPNAAYMPAGSEFDALVEQALGAPDPERVRDKAAEAMHLLLDREVMAVPLAGIYRIHAARVGVRGLDPHPAKTHQGWNTVWFQR